MNNVLDLRSELVKVFNGVKNKKLPIERAKELNNTAGKILNTARIQLEYAKMRKEVPVVDFLTSTQGAK